MLQQTKNCGCVCLWVCVCVCVCIYIYIYIYIYKFKSCWKRNYAKIVSNVSDFISPIRLRNVPDDLAGVVARVSGWGRTSDSKYNFLIILYFKLKNCTFQNDCFKGEELMAFRKFCHHFEYILFIL